MTMTTQLAASGAADWVCLAAAPTFAIMALLAVVPHSDPHAMFCATTHDASERSGMVWMYLLMSAFHSVPWLKLIANWCGDADAAGSA
jgi:hypothetical protein